MKKIELKTNIMCGSCLAKATPVLNDKLGEGNWNVDILTPKKTLTVTNQEVNEEQVIDAVKQAGYQAQPIN